MATKGQIKSIQALRGIAAVMVMIYHKRESLNTASLPIGETLFGAAAMGVDLFFIISGFIMVLVNDRTKATVQPARNAWHFWVNRFSRIAPLYYLAIIVFYWLVWKGFHFWHDPVSLSKIGRSFAFIPVNALRDAPFYGYAAITVGWTLNYEMFFYLILAVALLGGRYRYWIFTSIMLALLVLVPLVFRGQLSFDAMHHYHFGYAYVNMMTNPIIWDFLLGMLGGAWYLGKCPRWNRNVYYVLLSVFILWISGNLFLKWHPGHGITRWALPLAGLVFTLVFYEHQYGCKVPKMLLYLGKISFSVYLMHPIVQYGITSLLVRNGLDRWAGTPLYLLGTLAGTLGVATVTQYVIENHFSNWLKKVILKRS